VIIDRVSQRLHARSLTLLATLEHGFDRILLGWLAFVALACAVRLSTSVMPMREALSANLWTYALLVIAPIGSALLALRWFPAGSSPPQPAFRFARIGRWREVSIDEARQHPLHGTSGIMVSLMAGMLLNVVFRTGEYLLAIPPITLDAPGWVKTLQLALALDAVLFSSLYVIAFVTALRRVPLFPRLLLFIWIADLGAQLFIAQVLGARPDLPGPAAQAVATLLDGAVHKVLISVVIWAPYLLLSKRVNVTFRRRVPA
jgi:hypothetical protein